MRKINRKTPERIKNPFLRGIAFVFSLPVFLAVFAVIVFFNLIRFAIESFLKILSYFFLKLTIKTHKSYRYIFNEGLIIEILDEIDRNTEFPKIIDLLRTRQEEINDRLIYSVLKLPSKVLINRTPKMRRAIAFDIIKLGDIFQSLLFGDNNLNTIIAITAYEVSLNVFSNQESVEWARIQNAIGIAFQNYSYSESRSLIIKSLIGKGEVLRYLAPIKTTFFDFTANKFTLGEAQAKLFKAKMHLTHAEIALDFHNQALSVFTQDAFPEEWAKTMAYIGDAKLAIFNEIPNLFRKVVVRSHRTQKKHIYEDPFEAFKNQQRAKISPEESDPDFDEIISSIFTPEILSSPRNFKKQINSFVDDLVLGQKTLSAKDLAVPNWATNYQTFYNDAINFYNIALEMIPESSNDWLSLQISIGNYYRDCQDGDQSSNIGSAIQFYQNSLPVLVEGSEYWIIAHYQIGLAYKKLGEYQISKEHFEKALSEAISQQASLKVHLIAKEFGNSASKNQDWSCAIKNYKLAIEEIQKIRKVTTLEERRKELSSESVSLYKSLVQAYFNDGRIEEAIQYAELSRSNQIIDLISSSSQDPDGYYSRDDRLEFGLNIAQKMIDSTKQHTEETRTQYPEVFALTKAFYIPETEGKDFYTAQEEIAETFKKINFQITRRFYHESNLYRESIEQPINIKEIQKLIAFSGSAFLQFYTTEDTTYIFIIKDGSVDYHICDGVSLQDWIHDNWVLPFTSHPLFNQFLWKDKINDLLGHLAKLLRLDELIQKLGGIEELVFLPHQYFHLIPFSALPVSKENGKHITLGDYFAIRYVPSFRLLQSISERACPSPEYRYGVGRYFGTVENATGDLDFSTFECDSIAQMLNIPQHQRLKGLEQAHRNNFHQLVSNGNIQVLHLSHHAESRLDNPIESSLILSPTRTALARERLSLAHLLDPSWRMPTVSDVFLSCCETAVGDVSETDDILSLAVGFLIAGANRVISTLWSVDDLATSLFSIMYYQERLTGASCSKAIQLAQIRLKNLRSNQLSDFPLLLDYLRYVAKKNINYRTRITELLDQEYPFSSPYWWAAFTCQGIY